MPRRLLPWLAAALLVLAGLSLLLLAVLRASVLAPPATLTGRLTGSSDDGVITSATGLLDSAAPSVTIVVTADSSSGNAFVAVGRAPDVAAFLGSATTTAITGVSGGRLRVEHHAGDATLPDPAAVDIWAAAARGPGSISLVWPRTGGQWRFVTAADGAGAPATVSVTWTDPPHASTVPALVAIGIVLLVLALVLVLVLRNRAAGGPADADEGDESRDEGHGAADGGPRTAPDVGEPAAIDPVGLPEPVPAAAAPVPATSADPPTGPITAPISRRAARLAGDTGPLDLVVDRIPDRAGRDRPRRQGAHRAAPAVRPAAPPAVGEPGTDAAPRQDSEVTP